MSNVIQFTIQGVDKASGAFKSVSGSITSMAKSVAKAAAKIAKVAALAFAAGAAAIFTMTKRIADLQDSVAKMSTRLGIAVGKLSEFHHAAELGGIRTQTFDMALQRMARRVAEAAEGTGEAKAAIAELGLDAKKLADLPLDQQMNMVADSLNGVESQADKVRLAFKLFDSEGVAMLQTMTNGSQSFRDAAADLEFLGGVMTEQGTANAEKFKDSMTRVGAAFTGLSMGVSNELIPMITGLANTFANFIANNRDAVMSFVTVAIMGFLKFGIVIGQIFDKIRSVMANLFDAETMADTLGNIAQGFADMLKGVVDLVAAAAPHMATILIGSFSAGWLAFKELAAGALDYVFDFLTGNDLAEPFGEIVANAVRAAQAEMGGLPEAFNIVKDIVIESAGDAGDAMTSMFNINTELAQQQAEILMETLSEFGTIIENNTSLTIDKTLTLMDYMREQSQLFMAEQTTFAEEFATNLFDLMMSTTQAIGDAIANIIVDGADASEQFKNLAKAVLKQVIASYVAMKIQRAITSAFTVAAVKTEATAEASKAVGLAGANMAATMAAAPFPINLTAPAVAIAHMAATASTFATGAATGAAMGATIGAHGGLGYVPEETTVFVNKGERIISPRQNTDLTNFLESVSEDRGSSGDITVNVFTTAVSFDSITDSDIREFVAGKIIPSMDELDRQGIRPAAIERAIV